MKVSPSYFIVYKFKWKIHTTISFFKICPSPSQVAMFFSQSKEDLSICTPDPVLFALRVAFAGNWEPL